MTVIKDITNIEDIKIFVDDFYSKVGKDELLAPIFNYRLSTHWGPHLEKMYLFWNAALFGIKGYVGNPFSKHATMELNDSHFTRWISLFNKTIDLHFQGPIADEAKKKALTMAEMFRNKINANNNKGNTAIF